MAEDPIQEQLIAARQAQILQAATKVFAQKGFHRATIPDIAKEAGIAVGTIYNYFGKKEDLLMALLHRLNETDNRDSNLGMSANMELRDFVRAYLEQRYNYITEEGLDVMRAVLPEVLVNAELRRQYMEQIIEPTFALAESHFAALVGEGRVRDINVPATMRIISSTFLGLIVLRMMGEPVVEEQWDELAGLFTSIILDGILPK